MDSKEIYGVLREVQETSGALAKRDILKQHIEDPDFRVALRLALDPFITFGVGEITVLEAIKSCHGPLGLDRDFSLATTDTDLDVKVSHLIEGLRSRRLTGHAALSELTNVLSECGDESQRLLCDILLKDLRCGIGAKTVNMVEKGLVPEFGVMLADKLDIERVEFPVFVEPKFDGMRMVALFDPTCSAVQFLSRSGKAIETVPTRVQELLARMHEALEFPGGTVFDGELVGDDFRDTMRKARSKSSDFSNATYQLFDAVPFAAFLTGLSVSYEKRRKQLSDIYWSEVGREHNPPVKLPPSYRVSSVDELYAIYDAVRGRGLEGLIIKSPDGRWHKRRHRDWMKMKDCQTVDVPVVDAIEGSGKYEGKLGALIVEVDGVKVNVGSGFSDAERDELWFTWQWAPDTVRGRLIEVAYHEKTPDGSLRHPRFERFRDDKVVEDGVGV